MDFIRASCRHNFTHPRRHAEQLAFRNALDHPLDFTQVQALCRGKRVCVLVHGYKNGYDPAARAYLKLKDGLESTCPSNPPYDIIIGFFWPGSIRALGYWFAKSRTDRSSWFLVDLLDGLRDEVTRLDIEAHSLGCEVVLDALDTDLVKADLVLLSGAALESDALSNRYRFVEDNAAFFCVAHSNQDNVLKFGYRLASGGRSPLGRTGAVPVLGSSNLPLNVGNLDLTPSVNGHSGYKNSPEFFASWCFFAAALGSSLVQALQSRPRNQRPPNSRRREGRYRPSTP